VFLLVARTDMLPGHARHNLYLDICMNLEFEWTRGDNSMVGSPRSWNPCHMLKELFHHEGPNCSRIPQWERLAERLFNEHEDMRVTLLHIFFVLLGTNGS
jgi:hypothetical protein